VWNQQGNGVNGFGFNRDFFSLFIMSGCTHSTSRISKPQTKDLKNVAEAAIPPPRSDVQKTNRKAAGVKAWETRHAKQAGVLASLTHSQETQEGSSMNSPVVLGRAYPCFYSLLISNRTQRSKQFTHHLCPHMGCSRPNYYSPRPV
jgi:hypothetical protein